MKKLLHLEHIEDNNSNDFEIRVKEAMNKYQGETEVHYSSAAIPHACEIIFSALIIIRKI